LVSTIQKKNQLGNRDITVVENQNDLGVLVNNKLIGATRAPKPLEGLLGFFTQSKELSLNQVLNYAQGYLKCTLGPT
jgi:hypothetical protein